MNIVALCTFLPNAKRKEKMDDFERYGDYNEVDEPPKKSIVGTVIKAIIFAFCFIVIGVIAFRLVIFNYYPDSVGNIYFTDELTAYYNQTGGNIGALTQNLLDSRNYGYDDSRDGNFFAKNMIYIPETGELQVTLRFNTSLKDSIKQNYGVDFDVDSKDNFEYRLVAMRASDTISPDAAAEELGSVIDAKLVVEEYDSLFMYRYIKLVFDGVDLATGTPDSVDWLRLEISLNGVEMKEPYMILIYYNDKSFPLIPYDLSEKEKP